MTKGKSVLLCVTGSIAAYKSVEIARRLTESGAAVRVVMTRSAAQFVSPLTFEALTGNKVNSELFSDPLSHISLPDEADLLLIAPATANILGKFASGIADDLLSSLLLAYEGPLLIAPAMNSKMFKHPMVKKNIKRLSKIGVGFIGPCTGSLACGDEGVGRMSDLADIVEASMSALTVKDLSGRKILVTAGPTVEPVDSVRFISNRSSGKMGYAVALAASRRGAEVTLVSGPSGQKVPYGVKAHNVQTAEEMQKAAIKHFAKCDTLVMAAAVADFTPASIRDDKIRKGDISSIKLKKTPDILKELGLKKGSKFLIGFAAESSKDIESAKKKLKSKNLDLIILNDISAKGAGFDVDTNIVTVIDKGGDTIDYPMMKKIEIADIILDRMLALRP